MQVWNNECCQIPEAPESASLDKCGISVRPFLGSYSPVDFTFHMQVWNDELGQIPEAPESASLD